MFAAKPVTLQQVSSSLTRLPQFCDQQVKMLPMYHVELVPTDFALRLRPAFVVSLLVLGMLVIGKFAIRDWWGAVSLIFVILMGFFVLSGQYSVNASSALFYCVMAVISGVFDIISCVLYFQHSKYKIFETRASSLALLAQVVFLISPLALFASAGVSYGIFADCRDHAQELLPMRGMALDYSQLGWEVQGVAPPPAAVGRLRQQAPAPFTGQSQRLDGNSG